MNLTRKEWLLGWFPGNDSLNGDPRGLLRADNLELDERGVLGLIQGIQKVNPTNFGGDVLQIYSKYINNTKYRYVALSNGTILRSTDNFTSWTEVISGESFNRVGFASVLGQILITAGNSKIKDDGITVRQLGLRKPDNPPVSISTITDITQIAVGASFTSWEAEWGNIYDLVIPPENVVPVIMLEPTLGADNSTYIGIALHIADYNLSSIGGRPESPDDIFSFWFAADDGPEIQVRVEFMLDSPLFPSENKYDYTWTNPPGALYGAGGNGAVITARRGDFKRYGSNPALSWKDVHGVYIYVTCPGNTVYYRNMQFTTTYLAGKSYEYASMNIAELGTYVAKSPLSDPSKAIAIVAGQVKIQVDSPFIGIDSDTQVNKIWIFRRSTSRTDVIPIGGVPILDTWYRVGVIDTPLDSLDFLDTTTDEAALKLNIKVNQNLISVKDIVDPIIGIVSGYYDRTLYLTFNTVYISEKLNPDSIDILNSLKFEGGSISQNLWIVKSSLGVILVGTTQDIFEISGTMVNMPDGSIDLTVRPLGVNYPPLSFDVDTHSNLIYYPSRDGIRSIAPGGQSILVTSPVLDLLFQGETRHGIAPVNVTPKSIERYPIAITQQHIYASLPFVDGQRNVIDFNVLTQSWTYRWTNPISFFVEEDGTVLAGYGGGDNNLREFNTGVLLDGTTGQTIRFLTIFDDNQQPRNRKDVFTLKVTADMGSCPVHIWIAKDGETPIYLGSYNFNGITEHLIVLADVIEPGKAYQLKIEAYWLTVCKIYNFTVEYEPFPEQLNFLRIPNSNLGTFTRKRITNYAFVIDTLGNTVTYTPILDGISLSNSDVIFNGKRTFIHYFKTETIGTDIGGILSGGIFEYYGLNLEEIVSDKLPTPVKFLIIPNTDYGEPNRKRHSSYKFQINTRGYNVRFTPRLDGIDKIPLDFHTDEKLTVEYFFSTDTIAIDIGGTLESLVDEEFEFYGVIKPQKIELLPPRLKEFRIPESNLGIASRKRLRTLPMEINTNGHAVTFTPIVDGINGTPSVINTNTRKTAFHYFETDSFGTDYSGELIGEYPFEFYGLLKPEEVEILPVAKKLDQIGPLRLDKVGKLLCCRFRVIPWASEDLTIKFYDAEGTDLMFPIHTEVISVISNRDEIYEFNFPKTVKGSTIRIVIGPSTCPFHRYDMQLKIALSGMDADPKWVKVR